MTRDSTPAAEAPRSPVGRALDEMTASFERFCLAAGLEVLGEMLEADAAALCGPRHGRGGGRRAHRWGRTAGPIGATVERNRPPGGGGSRSTVGSRRVRSAAGVGSTCPNPSGRNGSGLAPTRQAPGGLVVGGSAPGGRVVELPSGGCG